MRTLQGQLLVATPQLLDANFFQSVVLMIQHSDEGAFGVVINRPSKNSVKEIWSQVGGAPTECEEPVYLGGPVTGPLLAIHTIGRLSDTKVIPGVYCSMDRDKVEQIVTIDEESFKFIVGSAGWGPGQLESEIDEGSWLTTPATVEIILGSGPDQWTLAMKQIGETMVRSALELRDVPDDPASN